MKNCHVLKFMFLLNAAIIIISSCSKSNGSNWQGKIPVFQLKGEIQEFNDTLKSVEFIHLMDTILFCHDPFLRNEFIFNFYNLNDLSFLGGFGKIGKGPNEILTPGYWSLSTEEHVI